MKLQKVQKPKIWQEYLFGHKAFAYCMVKENEDQEKNALNTLELHYRPSEMQDGFIVRYEGEKEKSKNKINRFLLFENHLEFLDFLEKPNVKRFFHEICLPNKPRKPYFDIDMEMDRFAILYALDDHPIIVGEKTNEQLYVIANTEGEKHRLVKDEKIDIAVKINEKMEVRVKMKNEFELLVAYIIHGIKMVLAEKGIELIPEKHIVLCTSHGAEKMSGHLLIHDFFHTSHLEAEAFNVLVLQHVPAQYHQWVDRAVYSSFQNFRIVGNNKYGSERKKELVSEFKMFSPIHNTKLVQNEKPNTKLMTPNNTELMTPNDKLTPNEELNIKELITVKRNQETELIHPTIHAFEICLLRPFTTNSLPSFIEAATEFDVTLKRRVIAKEMNMWENEPADTEMVNKVIELMKEKLNLQEKFPFKVSNAYATMISFIRIAPTHCPTCNKIHEKENPVVYINKGRIQFDCRRSKVHVGQYRTFLLGVIEVTENDNEPKEDSDDDYEDYDEANDYKITPHYSTITKKNVKEEKKEAKPVIEKKEAKTVKKKVKQTTEVINPENIQMVKTTYDAQGKVDGVGVEYPELDKIKTTQSKGRQKKKHEVQTDERFWK